MPPEIEMNGSMVFSSNRLENFSQDQFKPWKSQIYGFTRWKFILSGKAFAPCMDMKWNIPLAANLGGDWGGIKNIAVPNDIWTGHLLNIFFYA